MHSCLKQSAEAFKYFNIAVVFPSGENHVYALKLVFHFNRIVTYQSVQITKLLFPLFRQEISLSNACSEPRDNYNTRRNLELRAVIEDQWKKQLLEDMENEIRTNIEQLDKEREEELERTRNKKTRKHRD
jgi:hypothetical protein